MKVCRKILMIGVSGGLWLAAIAAGAQTNLPGSQPPADVAPASAGTTPLPADLSTRNGQIVLDTAIYGNSVNSPLVSAQNQITPELKDRLQRFERYRRAFLERQEALLKKSQAATDQDRAAVRQQYQQMIREYRQRLSELRLELKESQKDLIRKLPEHSEVIRSTREDARTTVREQMLNQREQIREQLKQERRGE